MKTSILRTVCFTFIVVLMNGFVSKAQNSFYDTKMENGKVTSIAKYVKGNFGMSVKESEARYTYDENGDLLKKETYVWNPTYEKNNNGRYYADYSEINWTPQYCTLYKKNPANSFVSVELLSWSITEKAFVNPVEMMVFRLNNYNRFDYLAFQKGDKYKEVINTLNYDKELIAGLEK